MIDKLSRFQELKYAFSKMNLKEDDYYGIAQIIDEAIERECLDSGGLKSCPFCGGQANVFGNYDDSEYHANCTNNECGCCWVTYYDTEEEAIEAWNRRT